MKTKQKNFKFEWLLGIGFAILILFIVSGGKKPLPIPVNISAMDTTLAHAFAMAMCKFSNLGYVEITPVTCDWTMTTNLPAHLNPSFYDSAGVLKKTFSKKYKNHEDVLIHSDFITIAYFPNPPYGEYKPTLIKTTAGKYKFEMAFYFFTCRWQGNAYDIWYYYSGKGIEEDQCIVMRDHSRIYLYNGSYNPGWSTDPNDGKKHRPLTLGEHMGLKSLAINLSY